ncbi:MAG: hypothetical protein HKN47_25580 [Pirellulaceae bacterium]|nr:hypothetical protein [Pirellulaceae bacterium]
MTVDFLLTLATLAGFSVPNDRLINGVNQTDLLLGKGPSARSTFYYQGNGVRQGKWNFLKAKHSVPSYAKE